MTNSDFHKMLVKYLEEYIAEIWRDPREPLGLWGYQYRLSAEDISDVCVTTQNLRKMAKRIAFFDAFLWEDDLLL